MLHVFRNLFQKKKIGFNCWNQYFSIVLKTQLERVSVPELHDDVSYIFLSTCIVIKSMLGEPINSIPLSINLGNYWTRQNVTLSKGTWFKLQVSLNILRQNEICADDLCTKHAKTQLVRMSDIFLKIDACVKENRIIHFIS